MATSRSCRCLVGRSTSLMHLSPVGIWLCPCDWDAERRPAGLVPGPEPREMVKDPHWPAKPALASVEGSAMPGVGVRRDSGEEDMAVSGVVLWYADGACFYPWPIGTHNSKSTKLFGRGEGEKTSALDCCFHLRIAVVAGEDDPIFLEAFQSLRRTSQNHRPCHLLLTPRMASVMRGRTNRFSRRPRRRLGNRPGASFGSRWPSCRMSFCTASTGPSQRRHMP